jgi:uncharacterized protein
MNNKKNIIILGASSKPDSYSYKAVEMLLKHGYNIFPVHPSGMDVAGHKTFKSLSQISEKIDTIAVYVNARISESLTDEILKIAPKRIIFNPGAENRELYKVCKSENIKAENACTLVLLQTGSF